MSSNVVRVSGDYKIKAAQGGVITLDVGLTGNVNITGNLTVTGEQTVINSTITQIEDNIIVLSKGRNSVGDVSEAGIEIARGDDSITGNAQMFFVEEIEWKDPIDDTNKLGLFVFKTTNGGISGIQTSSIYTGGEDLYLINIGNGVVSVFGTNNYETNVTDDDDIPNKKYVDDAIATKGGGKVTITQPANAATLTIANNKTLTVNNTLTFTGTDGITANFGTGGTVSYRSDSINQFSTDSTTSSDLRRIVSDETGTGKLVFNDSPTFIGTLSIQGVTTTGAPTGTGRLMFNNSPEILGTPKIGGIIVNGATGSTNLVFSNSPTIATPTITGNLTIQGVTTTGATGTGKMVFDTSPSFTTPTLGVATATKINGLTIQNNGTNTLNILADKTLTVSSTIELLSYDGITVNFANGGDAAYQADLANYVLSANLATTIYGLTIPDATTSNTAKSIGYLGTPINTQVSGYVLVIGDQSKTIYTGAAVTIDNSVEFPVGTNIRIIASASIPVDIVNGGTLQWAGQPTNQTGTRTIAQYGIADLIKVTSSIWYITGVGIT